MKPTVGVDVRKTKAKSDINLTIWDFAGHPEYTTTHQVANVILCFMYQLFLSAFNTIYFLVVDLTCSMEKITQSVEFWQQCIRSYAPIEKLSTEFSIVLIGNKKDAISLDKQIAVTSLLQEFQLAGKVSRWCMISGKNYQFM